MYRAFYDGMSLVHLPLFTLLLFIAVFGGVVIRVLRQKHDSYQELASMPLGEDEKEQPR